MPLLFSASACLGYLAFVYLSESFWPFSVPRGSVAARRFRKGRAIGVLVTAMSMTVLALLIMPPGQALPLAAVGVAAALLTALRLRQILQRAIKRLEPAAEPLEHPGIEPDILLDRTPAARSTANIARARIADTTDVSGRPWTPRTRFEAVATAFSLDQRARERYCREQGLRSSTLAEWRAACERALEQPEAGSKQRDRRTEPST